MEPLVDGRVPGFERLLGVRSSKGRYYQEYRHSKHDLERTLAAVNSVSWALAGASGDPLALVDATLPVVAELLGAQTVLLVSEHPGLGGGRVRRAALHPAAVDPLGELLLGDDVLDALEAVAVGSAQDDDPPAGRMRVSAPLACTVLVAPLPRAGAACGHVVAAVPLTTRADAADLAILGTVTNQLAGALETRHRAAESASARAAADSALRAVGQQAGVLAERDRMLQLTRHELVTTRERQVLAEERQRIARDLHDSVAQHVLSMGMQVEWCRTTSTEPEVVERLLEVKELARTTVTRIREAIFSLSGEEELRPDGLAAALRQLAAQHRVHGLAIGVRVHGEEVPLPAGQARALVMAAKEAVFNTVIHAEASRASIALTYGARDVRVQVSDNGRGTAAHLRACLEQSRQGCRDGYHRGLVNIEERLRLAGGTVAISDAPRRGVRVLVRVPRQVAR